MLHTDIIVRAQGATVSSTKAREATKSHQHSLAINSDQYSSVAIKQCTLLTTLAVPFFFSIKNWITGKRDEHGQGKWEGKQKGKSDIRHLSQTQDEMKFR
jgi:hypothetical protein